MSTSGYGRRRRKRNNSLTGIVVFIIAAAIFLLLSTTVFFNVETISVTGESNYTAQEIIEASGIKAGDNLVRTSTEKCADRIESRLAYIENAKITRSFPGTLIINVEPSVPAANFLCDNHILLISRGGKVLEEISEPKVGLLNFTGTTPMPGILPGEKFASDDEHKTEAIEKLMSYFLEEKEKETAAEASTEDEVRAEEEIPGSDGPEAAEYDPEAFYDDQEEQEEHEDKSPSAYEQEEKKTGFVDRVTLIDVTDRAALSYTYDGRIVVKLGSVNDIDYKINLTRKIVTDSIGERTEGVLTVLSDAQSASFLDKETLEHNAQVFSDNMATQTTAESEEEEEETKSTPVADPIME